MSDGQVKLKDAWQYNLGAKVLSLLDPETAHYRTIELMQNRKAPEIEGAADDALATTVAGLTLPNPLGLAAGFDKNAEVPNEALGLGFGFVEVGAVTPRPQTGNDRPRVFRLRADRAVINRFGFNNDGLEVVTGRLKARDRSRGVVGVNLGANKDSADRAADYVTGAQALAPYADFLTVNISSPNTPGLRALQSADALAALLAPVIAARNEGTAPSTPVFLKVAPDLTDEDRADIAKAAMEAGVDALIVSNTTILRPNSLQSRGRDETGGLSGAPLFHMSTELLRDFRKETGGRLPLIGVGGIMSARDAYEKIVNGASLVQLYTGLIYEGPTLPTRIVSELPKFLRADGFSRIEEAVGAGV